MEAREERVSSWPEGAQEAYRLRVAMLEGWSIAQERQARAWAYELTLAELARPAAAGSPSSDSGVAA